MDEKFSSELNDIILYSKEEAVRLKSTYIGTEHLLLGMIRHQQNSFMLLFNQLKASLVDLKSHLEFVASQNEDVKKQQKLYTTKWFGSPKVTLPLNRGAEKALKTSFLEAKLFEDDIISEIHVILCILRNDSDPVTKYISNLGLDYDEMKAYYLTGDLPKNKKSSFREWLSQTTDRLFGSSDKSEPKSTLSDSKVSSQYLELYFDLDEFDREEIAQVIALLSELYSEISGDQLEIRGSNLMQFDVQSDLILG